MFLVLFAGRLLPQLNNQLFDNEKNINMATYFFLFMLAILMFHSEMICSFKSFDIKKIDFLIVIGFVTFVCEVLAGIFVNVIGIASRNQGDVDTALNQGSSILLNLIIVFLIPFTEELAYRFCITSIFRAHPIVAGIVSVLLFAFMHVAYYVLFEGDASQLVAMLPYAVLGTGLYILYVKTENILYPIMLHIAINLIAVLI